MYTCLLLQQERQGWCRTIPGTMTWCPLHILNNVCTLSWLQGGSWEACQLKPWPRKIGVARIFGPRASSEIAYLALTVKDKDHLDLIISRPFGLTEASSDTERGLSHICISCHAEAYQVQALERVMSKSLAILSRYLEAFYCGMQWDLSHNTYVSLKAESNCSPYNNIITSCSFKHVQQD